MSEIDKRVTCELDGESHATFVCQHIARNAGLGFFTADPGDADPRPDAWCGACEEVLQREGRWNEVSMPFARLTLLCAGCYDRARLRNRPTGPLLSRSGFYCRDCRKHHHELPLDYGFEAPQHYHAIPAEDRPRRCELTEEVCIIDGEHFFVRGCLAVPIIDVPAALVWGVWASLSPASFERVLALWDSEERLHERPYFGWLSNSIPGYPETLSLETRVHTRPKRMRPFVQLASGDHPLAIEQRDGITVERAMAIAAMVGHRVGE
jgi:hypothetical protein